MAQTPESRSLAPDSLSHRDVLMIAVPITLSNATVPLIGFVDTVVIGQLGQAHLLGAIALSAAIFSFIYFLFNFLRMGTTGLTAQAVGADNAGEVAASLVRALILAAIIGLVLIVLQVPIRHFALSLMGASERVSEIAATYIDIRIWAAPAALANFALLGWFIGLGKATVAFGLQLFLNTINIVLAIVFVMVFDWSVPGVALAAVAAELVAVVAGLVIARRELQLRHATFSVYAVTEFSQMRRVLAVSRDILIRTACIQIAITFFVAQGARAGDATLATNAILFNIVLIAIYMIDGFAYAVETLVGQAVGARARNRFRNAIRLSTQGAALVSVVLAIVLWLTGYMIIDFMTTSEEIRGLARVYLVWAALVPITSVWCFLLDGIFIGATATATMRNMMFISMLGYFAAWFFLVPLFENHGLWIALHVLFLLRAVTLAGAMPGLEKRLFS